jgi:hypothetical protein
MILPAASFNHGITVMANCVCDEASREVDRVSDDDIVVGAGRQLIGDVSAVVHVPRCDTRYLNP